MAFHRVLHAKSLAGPSCIGRSFASIASEERPTMALQLVLGEGDEGVAFSFRKKLKRIVKAFKKPGIEFAEKAWNPLAPARPRTAAEEHQICQRLI
jgi:hypothetical protein